MKVNAFSSNKWYIVFITILTSIKTTEISGCDGSKYEDV
jgi:hypothetical protein